MHLPSRLVPPAITLLLCFDIPLISGLRHDEYSGFEAFLGNLSANPRGG